MFAVRSSDHRALLDRGATKESVESRATAAATHRVGATPRARRSTAWRSTSAGLRRPWTTPTSPSKLQTTSRVSAVIQKWLFYFLFYLMNLF